MVARDWTFMRNRIFDSRDIIDRLEDLRSIENLDNVESTELKILEQIESEGETLEDWIYGVTFIPEDDFVRYTQEYAEDTGVTDGSKRWPFNHIDWEAAANDLRADYSSFTFDGVDYLAR